MTIENTKVMYVGKKPFTVDNVAGTGKSWEGRGSVQAVTEDQARILLSHPDQWWPAGKLPTSEEVDAKTVAFFSGTKIPEGAALPKDVKEMSLAELKAHAKKIYGEKLRARTVKAALEEIAHIEEQDEATQQAVVTTATKVTRRRKGKSEQK